MTFCTRELKERGVAEYALSWRKWRRARGLSIRAMATMIGVSVRALQSYEIGDRGVSDATRDKIEAFVTRWAAVPEMQAEVEREAHRMRMRYRAAALARNRARGFNVNTGDTA